MKDIAKIVEKELLEIDSKLTESVSKQNGVVYQELELFLNSPTKRIRSLISLLYIKAFGKDVDFDVINILTAGELIHNASLLHDDVIDNAESRRGIQTIGKKFSSKISILAGDYLVSIGIENLLKVKNLQILNLFLECTQKMSQAEIKQYFSRGKKIKIDEYLEIAEGKTACLCEAMLCSLSTIKNLDFNHAKDFAKNFGILFQLKNDLEETSSKADKANNIFTPKDILGIEKTNILIDNYLKEIRREICELPDNIYKTGLEDLLGKL